MFNLPKLKYSYDALEPYIDAQTVEIHYTKHHNTYTTNLNKAISGTSFEGKSVEEILKGMDMENKPLRNNAGGFYNHNLYWDILGKEGSTPSSELSKAIDTCFGSFSEFKKVFSEAATGRFGSGWAWLCLKDGKLQVCSTPNQDNPLMPSVGCGGTPILGIDVWEHAYYLKYQNRRADYIEAFFKVVNWERVSELYALGK